ncbi:MAG: MFS transporter [Pseudomonadota bacterium]
MILHSLSLRFAGFYGAVFLVLGVFLPYWPLWLAERGLSAVEIGWLLALTSWLRIATTPALASLADRSGHAKGVILALALVSLAGFATFALADGFWRLLAVQLVATSAFFALLPVGESHSVGQLRRAGLDYGRVRLWGSLTFIVGALLAGEASARVGAAPILWLILIGLAITFAAGLALPGRGAEPRSGPGLSEALSRLRRAPRLLGLLLAGSLLQASHAAYYGFSTLAWTRAGHGEATIGWLWAEGVLLEVAFFAVSAAWLTRLKATGLLILAGLAGILRWSVMASTTALPALILAQGLHALTFAAAHLAVIHLIAVLAPKGTAATTQGLYAALSGGLVMGLAALLAGWLFEHSQAVMFIAMAGFSLAGLVLAWTLRRETISKG